MKIKTSELTGIALDLAVSNSGKDIRTFISGYSDFGMYRYSTDWAQGGPIIEREKIALIPPNDRIDEWEAVHPDQMHDEQYGTTPLVAAMRTYVASKLGDEVDIPEELCK